MKNKHLLALMGGLMIASAAFFFGPGNTDAQAAFTPQHYNLSDGGSWDGSHYTVNGQVIKNAFFCDGTYTYYLQADGSPMKDQLTYHPDGEHIIYFDENGHEVFSNFHHVSKSIAGEAVDDECFFDVNGYMYVNVLTYDQTGTKVYYANAYGVLEDKGWFQYDPDAIWADGTDCNFTKVSYGYGNADGSLLTSQWTYNWNGQMVYVQGDGSIATGVLFDGATYYSLDGTDGHIISTSATDPSRSYTTTVNYRYSDGSYSIDVVNGEGESLSYDYYYASGKLRGTLRSTVNAAGYAVTLEYVGYYESGEVAYKTSQTCSDKGGLMTSVCYEYEKDGTVSGIYHDDFTRNANDDPVTECWSETDANGVVQGRSNYFWEYDSNNFKSKYTYESYDSTGALTIKVVHEYTTDTLGDVLTDKYTSYDSTGAVSYQGYYVYTYYAKDQVATCKQTYYNKDGSIEMVTTESYDTAGYCMKKVYENYEDGKICSIDDQEYTRDTAHNVIARVESLYDENGLLTYKMEYSDPAYTTEETYVKYKALTTTDYDENGKETSVEKYSYTYNSDYQVTEMIHTYIKNGTVSFVEKQVYELNSDNQRTKLADYFYKPDGKTLESYLITTYTYNSDDTVTQKTVYYNAAGEETGSETNTY